MLPIHPKIVHFPVALLISAAFFGILALLIKSKRNLFKEILTWNLLLGVLGAIAAIISGLREEETLVHNDAIHEIMETHELLGFIFSGIFLAILIWILVRKSRMKIVEFTIIVVMLIAAAGLLGYSAHLGGKMVYKEGAGVIPMKEILSHEEHHHHHGEAETEQHDENNTIDSLEQSHHNEGYVQDEHHEYPDHDH